MSIGVIGAGRWGQNHIRTLSSLGELGYVCSDDLSQAKEVAEVFGVPFGDCQDLLTKDHIDGVIISTPAPTHEALIEQCLNAGKHVLVEKPMVLNYERAVDLIGLAERRGLHLMVGHLLCYHPAFKLVQDFIKNGKLGDPLTVHCTRVGNGVIRTVEDVFWDLAVHDIAILNVLFRQPIIIEDVKVFKRQMDGGYDQGHIFLRMGSKIKAHINVSWAYPIKQHECVIQGTKGALVFDEARGHQEKLSWIPMVGGPIPYDSNHIEYLSVENQMPLTNEVKHFIDCIASGEKPLTLARTELPVLKALCDIQDRVSINT